MTHQFETVRFIAVPLTPVHVGGGDEAVLRPEQFRLTEDSLEVFAVRSVLDRLPASEREGLVAALIKDPLGGLERIRSKVMAEAVLETILVSRGSRRELEQALHRAEERGRQRAGTVQLFLRSGGRPVLPGSSVKGAVRTAWLATCATGLPPTRGGPTWQRYRDLQTEAFGLAAGTAQTDTDPLRDVTVSDATLPDRVTQIDQVHAWKRLQSRDRRQEPGYGFDSTGQMHWERLLSVADGGEPPIVRLDFGVRAQPVREERRRIRASAQPSRSPSNVAALLEALNRHHRPLWIREVEEKYFPGAPGDRIRQSLDVLRVVTLDGQDPDGALVRIGRAGHAEAKSIAGWREVHRPQARDPRAKYAPEGSTRHVIRLGDKPVPFGWMMLVREERWPSGLAWLAPPSITAHRERDTTPTPGAGTPPRAGLRFRRGEKAIVHDEVVTITEDVPTGQREAMVEFEGGDREPVNVKEIRKR